MLFPGQHMPERTAAEKRAKRRAFDQWCAEEKVRIARQRAAMKGNMGPAPAELQRLMLERAWDLLEAGECEAADALLEFVPEDKADALLNEFFPESG